jgi:response regulator of citrate/malate metabolism
VVLLDLYLPDSMGADTFHNVLNQASGVAVVVLTGRDDEELIVNAVQHGVQDYLVKGAFDSKQLAHTLRCAIERQALLTAQHLNWNEQAQLKESQVSDDLLAPLAAIHELVTVLLGDITTPLTAQQRKQLNTISRKASGLYSRIDNLLAMRNRPDKSRTEAVEPHSHCQSANS